MTGHFTEAGDGAGIGFASAGSLDGVPLGESGDLPGVTANTRATRAITPSESEFLARLSFTPIARSYYASPVSDPEGTRPPSRPLTLGRFFHLYFPLALTFLLMSGSSPIINKGIGHLADETIGFATLANAFVICIFLYSPTFSVRDVAQKYVRGRTSYLRTILFFLTVASAGTLLLLLLGLTPVLDWLILKKAMNLPDELVDPVKRSVLSFLPVPTLIVFRGVHQAVHIINETPKWIGIGTICRFTMMILFVFLVAVPLEIEGGVMGGLAFSIGILVETVVTVAMARKTARFVRSDPAEGAPPTLRVLWDFSYPLFLANAMGVFLNPLTMRIVNGAFLSQTSAAAYGIVRTFTWTFSSTLFAMQTMALAKADTVRNLKRLALYELIPVCTFTSLFIVVCFLPAARSAVLVGFFDVDSATTVRFITEALPIAIILPMVMAIRSTCRGLLLRSGRTSWVTFSNTTALILLLTLSAMNPSALALNGARMGYLCGMASLLLEMGTLVLGVSRVGIKTCVNEGRRHAVWTAPDQPQGEANDLSG